jgi:predicted ATPase/DNA-binding winged helix-turn-helix (wHTH) protein
LSASAFSFGEFRLLPEERTLLTAGKPVRISSRALDILTVLLDHAGELVSKDQLIACAWPNTRVEENNLRVHIGALRKLLGESPAGVSNIATVPGRGYSFVAHVERESVQPLLATVPASMTMLSLPAPLTRMIGRAETLVMFLSRMRKQRLVTIIGPGGMGKTTIALAMAKRLNRSLEHHAGFVDLSPLTDPQLLPSALVSVLGIPSRSENPLVDLLAFLRDKRMLIVLDSCEHLVEAAAAMVEALLKGAPGVQVLATSREPLGVEGEWAERLAPLAIPESPSGLTAAQALAFPAIQLLAERAAAGIEGFRLSDEDVPAAVEICQRLDGIPLAIELAAARVGLFGIPGLAARLNDRLAVLVRGRRTAAPRHKALRATLDWSYDLLSGAERCLLNRLGIFAAGFTLEAANAVMSDQGYTSTVFDEIANLVAKSLVTVDGSPASGRWRLLETTRAYALEKLAESGETEQVARRCAEFFRDLVGPVIQGLQEPPDAKDLARYGREIDNVRATLDWSFSPLGDVVIGVALTAAYAPVWLDMSLAVECRNRIERALDCLEPDSNVSLSLIMQLHISLGIALIYTMGSFERTRMVLAKALEAAETLDDVGAQLETLRALVGIYQRSGECRAAQSTAERFSGVALRTGDPTLALIADRLTAHTLHHGGQLREAQRCFERALEFYVAPTNRRHTIWTRYDQRLMARAMLAPVLWLRGFVDQGVTQAQATLEQALAIDHKLTLCWVLHYAAYPVALSTGDLVTAGEAVAMLMDLATSLSAPFWKMLAHCLEGKLLIKHGEFGRGSIRLRVALETCERTGWTICYPEFLGALAEGLAGLGQFTEALAMIDRALARADRGGERWFVAELLRNKGELLLHGASNQSISMAEHCFSSALEVAREQDALSWELRSALSFARLRIRQDRQDDARQLLAPVYGRFTEGFETPDLRSASAMLQSLSSRPSELAT